MTTNSQPSPSQPAGQPQQPEAVRVTNWSYPFPLVESTQSASAQHYFNVLSNAEDGFYPLGANGIWHGGIHFGVGTEKGVKQSNGVNAIADGEVVAYRLDSKYPELSYPDDAKAAYSTGFVLVRHRLQLPPAPQKGAAPSGQKVINPPVNNPAKASATPAHAATPTSPILQEPELVFYSLYMHQLDWAGYQVNPKLATNDDEKIKTQVPQHLLFWKGDKRFKVGAKAKDVQDQPPPPPPPPPAPTALDAENATNSELDREAPQLNSAQSVLPTPPQPRLLPAVKGIRVRDSANGKFLGILPQDSELTIFGITAKGWAQIDVILQGTPVGAVVGSSPDKTVAKGWVFVNDLDLKITPNPLDSVVVLDKPCPIKAGELVGYLGQYLRHRDTGKTSAKKVNRPILHLEVFTGDALPEFIQKSKARAKDLSKTVLVLSPGAMLVQPAVPDQTLPAGSLLKPTSDSPSTGPWAKVQPVQRAAASLTAPAPALRGSATAPRNTQHPSPAALTPAGNPFWVERSSSSRIAVGTEKAWAKFPLQLSSAKAPKIGFTEMVTRAELQQAGSSQDDKGVGWWMVSAGSESGDTISGWVCDKDHPKVQWESPWAWPGFDVIDNSSISIIDAFKRHLYVSKQLFQGDEEAFKPTALTVNGSELITRLEKAIDRGGDNDGTVTAKELANALTVPWLAKALSHLIVRYDSEWGGNMDRWNELSELMKDHKDVWQAELLRVKKLQWWDQVKAVKGFPESPMVYHFHPIGLIGNFLTTRRHPTIEINGLKIELEFLDFYDDLKITEEDYQDAASNIGCEINAIKAVSITESGGSGSYFTIDKWDKVPTILFERHYFHRLTNGVYDSSYPDVSNANSGGYGNFPNQYKKLLIAYGLNRTAALKSASWGKFQIMGANHSSSGASTVEGFVLEISKTEKNHLKKFVALINSNPRLKSAVTKKDWLAFALIYNGSAQKNYDVRIRENYEKLIAQKK